MKSIYISASRYSKLANNLIERLSQELGSYRIKNNGNNLVEYQNDIQYDIKNDINRSDVVLGIITDENPFVFFELGVAIGLRKKIFILRTSDVPLPTDLRRVDSILLYPDSNSWLFEILNYLEFSTLEPGEQMTPYNSAFEEVCSYKNNPQHIESLDPKYFEELVYHCFYEKGIRIEKNIEQIHFGYDFIIYDFASFDRAIIEIKKYNSTSKVSIGKVQQLIGAMYSSKIDNAIMISTADYTKSAKDFAEQTNENTELKLKLWQMDDFIENMNK